MFGKQIYDEVTSWLHSKGKTWKDLHFVGVDGARENHTTFAASGYRATSAEIADYIIRIIRG